jgi:hypothetical protein
MPIRMAFETLHLRFNRDKVVPVLLLIPIEAHQRIPTTERQTWHAV